MKTLFLSVLFMTTLTLPGCTQPNASSDHRTKVAMEMVQAWNKQDWDRVYGLFADDGVLQSMMMEPIVGRENIRVRLSDLTMGIEQIELQIRNVGVIGDVVVLERIDDFIYNGKHGSVPVVGVMEISNGKVTEWREYYDHATLAESLASEPMPEAEILEIAENEIRTLTNKLQMDWNRGDMTGYLNAYWNNEALSVMYGDNAVRGWQELSHLFRKNWTNEEQMGDFFVKDVAMVVRFPQPDTAIASGGFEHQFPAEKVVGAFSHTWHRFDDGHWRIVHEHTSRALVQ